MGLHYHIVLPSFSCLGAIDSAASLNAGLKIRGAELEGGGRGSGSAASPFMLGCPPDSPAQMSLSGGARKPGRLVLGNGAGPWQPV